MRRSGVLVSLVLLSWLGGLVQDARAGVTIDLVFQDATTPSGHWAYPGDPGPGCDFGGPAGGSVSWGHCMDVIVTSTVPMVSLSTSVTYDSDNGLAIAAMYEWKGVRVPSGGAGRFCSPAGGLADYGGVVQSFDCVISAPFNPPKLAAGTYRIGTIVWDTTGLTPGFETISTYIDDLVDGVGAVINGNVVVLTSADIVVRTHYFTSDPPFNCGDGFIGAFEECDDGDTTPGDGCDADCQIEPGWTCVGVPSVCTPLSVPSMSATGVTVLGLAVFGIGVVGLVIAARRRLN